MKLISSFLILAYASALSGCFSSGTKINPSSLTQIEKGKTTKAEVVALLGNPLSATFTDDGKELLTWSHGQIQVKSESFIPIVGPIIGGTETKLTTFQVLVSKEKIVEDTLWNTSQADSRVWAAGSPPASNPKVVYARDTEQAEVKASISTPSEKARLYVYREKRFKGGGVNFQVYVNGDLLGVIGSGSFTYTTLDLKPHVIRISTPENTQDIEIIATAGKLLFLKAEPQIGIRSITATTAEVDASEGKRGVLDGRMVVSKYAPQVKIGGPNKAPEPTPGPVTPRATEGVSK